jgi:Fe-S oxidoreductase
VPIKTFLDFTPEGGLKLAADLCNGNGECRKAEKLMCPSFQASGDEYHTTRARAQSLRAIFSGRMPLESFTGHDLYDVLDLCLECKGCKTECPSQVDMAKMKSEFLYHYQQKHGTSLRSRLIGHIATANKWGSLFPSFFNAVASSWIGRRLQSVLGISKHRSLPKLSQETFTSWFNKQNFALNGSPVALFVDTYTEYNRPEAGIAACKVLHALGYDVILISGECCGRPLISKGLLPAAKAKAQSLAEKLSDAANKNIPVIHLEPSCHSAITDDYKGLLGPQHNFTAGNYTFDAFVHKHLKDGLFPLDLINAPCKMLVHTHCHQKALAGSKHTLEVLRSLPGCAVKEISSGCCGMAGSFGYEKEHYDFSMKIGALHLFPAIEAAEENTLVVANGFSCACQIDHGTDRKSMHLAEAIFNRLSTAKDEV